MSKIPAIQEHRIKIEFEDSRNFGRLAKQYLNIPSQKLAVQMYDIFTPYIKNRADFVARKKGISAQDYFQELSIKFIQYLKDAVKTKYPAYNMALTLNCTNPTSEDIISTSDTPINKITSQEELVYASEHPDNKTLLEKAEEILQTVKAHIPEKKYNAIDLMIDGKSYEEIGKILGISPKRATKIYYEFIKKILQLNGRGLFDHIFFDDTQNQELIVSRKLSAKSGIELPSNAYNVDPAKIWKSAKSAYKHWNTIKELDSMMKTQTTSKELMFDKSSQTKIKKKLEKNPDFKFRLELNRRNNNRKFKKEAQQISTELFGKNIFEFV